MRHEKKGYTDDVLFSNAVSRADREYLHGILAVIVVPRIWQPPFWDELFCVFEVALRVICAIN